jgi:hypothetical protein
MINVNSKELESYCGINIVDVIHQIKSNALFFEADPHSLLKINEFVQLQICSPIKYESYISTIDDLSDSEKLILILSMQSLSGDKYLSFLISLADKFEKKIVKKELLMLAVFPGDSWNTYLIENFEDKDVVKVIHKLKLVLPDKEKELNELLSGLALEKLVIYRFNSRSPVHAFKYLTF